MGSILASASLCNRRLSPIASLRVGINFRVIYPERSEGSTVEQLQAAPCESLLASASLHHRRFLPIASLRVGINFRVIYPERSEGSTVEQLRTHQGVDRGKGVAVQPEIPPHRFAQGRNRL